MEIYYIDRRTGKKEKEVITGDRYLKWVYETRGENNILETIVKKKWFSTIYGKMQDFSLSRKKIAKFIDKLNIDITEAEKESIDDYLNFNDFFIRKLKPDARPICHAKEALISPADGRILAYENIDIHKVTQVKGQTYVLEELFQDSLLAKEYQGGTCIIIRLNPSDYHRFHFPDDGIPQESIKIKGHYHSVNPIALRKIAALYCKNKRELTSFQSDHFKEIIMIEVGATCVGSIVQTYRPNQPVIKGEEKGYFKFGGSTVILFLKPRTIKVDEDIIKNTKEGLETKIDMGERIGIAL